MRSGRCSISNSGFARSSTAKAFKHSPRPPHRRGDPAPAGSAGAWRPESMRILWLKTGLLLPLDAGGKLRTWHLLRHLAMRHEVTYLSFADPDAPDADRNGMSAICAALHTVARRDPPKGSLGFYADAASRVLDPLPYAVGKYRSRQYCRTLRTLLARQRFDVLVCDFLFPVVN